MGDRPFYIFSCGAHLDLVPARCQVASVSTPLRGGVRQTARPGHTERVDDLKELKLLICGFALRLGARRVDQSVADITEER